MILPGADRPCKLVCQFLLPKLEGERAATDAAIAAATVCRKIRRIAKKVPGDKREKRVHCASQALPRRAQSTPS